MPRTWSDSECDAIRHGTYSAAGSREACVNGSCWQLMRNDDDAPASCVGRWSESRRRWGTTCSRRALRSVAMEQELHMEGQASGLATAVEAEVAPLHHEAWHHKAWQGKSGFASWQGLLLTARRGQIRESTEHPVGPVRRQQSTSVFLRPSFHVPRFRAAPCRPSTVGTEGRARTASCCIPTASLATFQRAPRPHRSNGLLTHGLFGTGPQTLSTPMRHR